MFNADRKIIEVKETRNALETYVYDFRAALDSYGDKAKYIEAAPREAFLAQLNQVEEWLYGEGAEASKDQYQSKLEELKIVGNVIDKRF
jgi:heat shock 70kDa protein 4